MKRNQFTLLEYLRASEAIVGRNPCWLWPYGAMKKGCDSYGVTHISGKTALVHRVAFRLLRGPIPDRFVIDHLCNTKRCCNPWHMRAVTNWEDTLRGDAAHAKSARASHCPAGHELAGANLSPFRLKKQGKRVCQVCLRERARAYHRARGATAQRARHLVP